MIKSKYIMDTFGLEDRRILVVGGRGNIGFAIVQVLASAGAEVWLTSRKADVLEQAISEVQGNCPGGLSP